MRHRIPQRFQTGGCAVTAKRHMLLDAGPYSVDWSTIGGIGLRLAEMADALSDDLAVTVFAPHSTDPVDIPNVEMVTEHRAWPSLLADADAVLSLDMADPSRLEETISAGRLLVVENAPPIEHLQYPSIVEAADPVGTYEAIRKVYERQLLAAHHFLCRSRVEKATLVGNLCCLGRLSTSDISRSSGLSHLVSLVPIGFGRRAEHEADEQPPRKLADFLWTGGVWGFYRPEMFVEALRKCRDQGQELTGAFLYAKPAGDNAESIHRLRRVIAELGMEGSVYLLDEPPGPLERHALIKAARGLVCIAEPGVENETCVRLRIRDSRLYGVPTVVDGHGPTYDELARDGLGQHPPAETSDELADVLSRIGANSKEEHVRRTEYRYDQSLKPFIEWLLKELK